MTNHANARASPPASSDRRPIGTTSTGIALAYGFFLLGAVNYYLIPRTGGLVSLYWDPLLYDLVLNRFFLALVYIPLIQLPLATVFYLGARGRVSTIDRQPDPALVFGLFGLVAAVRVTTLVAVSAYPWDAGSLQGLVDAVLFGRLGGVASFPELANTVFLFYFPLVVAIQRLPGRGQPGGGEPAAPGDSRSAGQPAGTAPRSASPGSRALAAAQGVSNVRLGVPYWVLVVVVAVVLVAGLATGGLESAIGIAGILLSLYQLQPGREPD